MNKKKNKNNKISFRLTDSEMKLLESIASSNKSDFIRNALLESKPPIHKFDKAMVVQISRIGNNLNQIAKYVNKNESIDLIALKHIIEISNLINSLLDKDKRC